MVSHIEYAQVNLDIADKTLVSDLSFTLEAGKVLSVLGRNGAGKTSILKMIIGHLQPSSGEISICGKNIKRVGVADRARLIGYVPQSFACSLPVTVSEFVAMSLYSTNGFKKLNSAATDLVEKILNEFGLVDFRQRTVSTLSGGERQRVLLAAALVHEPKILLLDEPTCSLDPVAQEEVLRVLKALKDSRKYSIINVSHDLRIAAEISDRVIGISQGAKVFDGLFQDLEIQQVFACQQVPVIREGETSQAIN